ncbi:MAG: tRNA (adenosine(37)-N6)-dimethylallyltransferase MiaA [Hyphomicrobiales bacterium]
MAASSSKRALLIAGPTASGKSALALKLALERNGVIINADAMQVYRELRILTARPSPTEEAEVPHRLYGHVPGRESYSVARWLADARRQIERSWGEGLLPIITGGTGLYFRALQRGLAEVPAIPTGVRERWRNFEGDLHAELVRHDPETAARLEAKDRQRLIRALEVVEGTGRPLSFWQGRAQSGAALAGVDVERIILDVPRAELYRRAEARFDRMIAEGAINELRPLLCLDPSLPVMKAIGVRELSAHLRGEIKLDEAIARAKTATRHYIKRQVTWWRGEGGWDR